MKIHNLNKKNEICNNISDSEYNGILYFNKYTNIVHVFSITVSVGICLQPY